MSTSFIKASLCRLAFQFARRSRRRTSKFSAQLRSCAVLSEPDPAPSDFRKSRRPASMPHLTRRKVLPMALERLGCSGIEQWQWCEATLPASAPLPISIARVEVIVCWWKVFGARQIEEMISVELVFASPSKLRKKRKRSIRRVFEELLEMENISDGNISEIFPDL